MKITLTFLLLIGFAGIAGAKPWWMRGIESNETDFLPPDTAFRVGASVDGDVLRVRWVIADGYYLYRHRMAVKAESPDLIVAAPVWPKGIFKTDPYLGTQEIYQQQVVATVPYTRLDAGAHPLQIKVTYQGCAEAGLCYPPITKVIFPKASPTEAQAGSEGAGVGASGDAGAEAGGSAELAGGAWKGVDLWVGSAIILGALAFLLAGFVLRKGRKLDLPAP